MHNHSNAHGNCQTEIKRPPAPKKIKAETAREFFVATLKKSKAHLWYKGTSSKALQAVPKKTSLLSRHLTIKRQALGAK